MHKDLASNRNHIKNVLLSNVTHKIKLDTGAAGVPTAIIDAIAAYGDARADANIHLAGGYLADCIRAIRQALLPEPTMTNRRPTEPGWYWYVLPGSWDLQPARVFEFEGELWYTLEAIGRNGPDEGLRLADCDDQTRWSTEPIAMPSEASVSGRAEN